MNDENILAIQPNLSIPKGTANIDSDPSSITYLYITLPTET